MSEALLRATGLFDSLGDAELAAVAARAERVTARAGEVVLREGEPQEACLVVESGSAQLFTFDRDGTEVVLARLVPGAYVGEEALSSARPRRAKAYLRAFSELVFLKLPRVAKDLPAPAGAAPSIASLFRPDSVLFRSLARQERFADGEVVFREGEPALSFYVVQDGIAGVWFGAKRVSQVKPGESFGVLKPREPRASTVKAEGELSLLVVDAQRFVDLVEQTPELRPLLATLEQVHLLTGGFTTQHSGTLDGQPAMTTIFHLRDGRRLLASRVIGRELYSVTEAGADATATAEYRDAAAERSLALAGSRLVGITVRGAWDELGEGHRMLLERQPIEAWQLAVFRTRGTLRLEDEASFGRDSDVVCACMQATRGALCAAIRAGANDVATLGQRTGAGTVCGGCVPKLEGLLGRPDWTLAACVEVIRHTPDVRSYRFRPWRGALTAARPGQHIVLQARIDDRWIERPYTLSSAAGQTDHYEITVKREPRGVFSGWLFELIEADAYLRISKPLGTFTLDLESSAPVACFVAGIGVTPAVAMVRSLAGSSRRIHVDYSYRGPDRPPFLAELEEAARARPGVTLRARDTRSAARIGADDVAALARELPDAEVFLCGPGAFRADLTTWLTRAGVPAARVRTEEFTPAGARPASAGARDTARGRPTAPWPSAQPPGPRPSERPALPEVRAAEPVSIEEEARAYLLRFYHEKGVPDAFEPRFHEVVRQIRATGTYTQTYDELAFGAKLAWRNASRCIGRLFWQGLQVLDRRDRTDPAQIFASLCEHIELATNGGNLRAAISVFAPGARLWNSQLIRYAGYRQPDGTWIGDHRNGALTEAIAKLGWAPPRRTDFDVLPLVIDVPGHAPSLHELPPGIVLEVPIEHPALPWFADLNLRWHALPAVSELSLDCGGVVYTCAPFNGWYMGTEIGARNLSDEYRYNMLPEIARRMNLDTTRDRTLWRDRALLELNVAVLHSFERAGVKMVDHHAASTDFLEFCRQEAAAGRRIDARWDWIVPPMSGSLSPLFHVDWTETVIKPNYFPQARRY